MSSVKTIPYVKTRVLQTKRLLDSALKNVNRYAQALLQYQSDDQQLSVLHRPQYAQTGGTILGKNAQVQAKAVEKINQMGSRLTAILDSVMIMLKSKNDGVIYTHLGAILFYLDMILDPFLRSPAVASLNTWSGIHVKKLLTNPLVTSVASMNTMLQQQKKPIPTSSFSLLKGMDAEKMFKGDFGPPMSIFPSLEGLMDFGKPRKRSRRTQQQS